ncbi:MAG TPA: asparagine synthase-related protein [Thermoanaerobaculia bacterium]|jgi:asparagine synthase (glutamine-hydrolysing)|nr:asparagine synthase-related protein [Thermoanaerobaculia bacterium]
MSGIAGVVRLDGAPAHAESLARALAYRGPDATTEWTSGSVALVHALLRTTPEDAGVYDDGDLVVVADARLDGVTTTHPATIAAAWRARGEACVEHFDGEFAFAVWDTRTRTLFCARDHFGVKPFVYAHLPGRLFAFASDTRTLLALPEIPRTLDEQRIAAFLEFRFESREQTFHSALRRLPGAHTLTLRDGRIALRQYWTIRDVKPLRLRGGDAAYAEGYREHFLRAVRVRMRATDPREVGSMLSGGLDSSAIACVARDELRAAGAPPLPVFSWIFSDAMEADEREFQEHVFAAGGMRPFVLDSRENHAGPWSDLDALLLDVPPFAPNHYLNVGMARTARGAGVRILLDGLAGDITVSRGTARLVELFLRARIPSFARELRALARRSGTPASRLFLSIVAARVAPMPLLRLAESLRGRPYGGQRFRSVREEQMWQLASPFVAEGLELSDRLVAWLGVEGRYPFLDRRLAEYCVSLPSDQKLADGYSRMVARRAMEGIVPDAVRWRAGKGAPALHIVGALRADHAPLDDFFARDADLVARWVAIDALRRTDDALRSERAVGFQSVVRLWTAATLARWLRMHS